MAYRVEIWGSNKDLGNDDHWFDGTDHVTAEAALAEVPALQATAERRGDGWGYVCVEGPDGRVFERTNPAAPRLAEREDRSEFAMQQGMGHGVDAYNEANGEEAEVPGFGPR